MSDNYPPGVSDEDFELEDDELDPNDEEDYEPDYEHIVEMRAEARAELWMGREEP